MNKKMRDLLAKIEAKRVIAQSYMDDGERDKATALLNEIKDLKVDFANEKALFELEQDDVPNEPQPTATNKLDGFKVMAKAVRSPKTLTQVENVLITGENAESGENYLVPEDVRLAIIELRREFKAAKDLVTVMPTRTLSGSFNFESGTPAGLTDFDEGDETTGTIGAGDDPTFIQKPFKIAFKGKLWPVSNILLGAEQAGLMAYLRNWFVKNAIISENIKVFATLKANKEAKSLVGWQGLKTSINTDLDPSCLINGVIVTNQSGFNILDNELDGNGRPILQENPANKTEKTFQGLPIKVFTDAQLPNTAITGTSPIFYGNLKDGVYFMDYMGYQFAMSDHFYFNKNQKAMRVLEGFDAIQADVGAYVYGVLSAGTNTTLTTINTTLGTVNTTLGEWVAPAPVAAEIITVAVLPTTAQSVRAIYVLTAVDPADPTYLEGTMWTWDGTDWVAYANE